MANSNPKNLTNHENATNDLIELVSDKMKYLKTLEDAISNQDDRLVYQLINNEKYSREILKARHGSLDTDGNEELVKDIHDQIAEYLSKRLIEYLKQKYPFFYFEKTALGKFQFYFGNWWGRRLFGELDVLNVEFNFNDVEYRKLQRSFELEKENKRLNSDEIDALSKQNDELQNLIDTQNERDEKKAEIRQEMKRLSEERVMPWKAAKQKTSKERLVSALTNLTDIDEKANNAYQLMRGNEKKVLSLSKEDTLIGYEKQSIVAKFGNFDNFVDKNAALYRDYIANLIASGSNGQEGE